MNYFDRLPEEMILKIVSNLSQWELCSTLQNVCLKFRRISKDVTLYRSLFLDENFSVDAIARLFAEYGDTIKSIVIENRRDLNRILELAGALRNVQTLKVNSCSGCALPCGHFTSEVDSALLSNVLKRNWSGLASLWITQSAIRPAAKFVQIGDANLKEIVVRNAYYQRCLDESAILSLNSLQLLNLQNLIISGRTLTEVILRSKNSLMILKLDVWEPQNLKNDSLMSAISYCRRLQKLSLNNLSLCTFNDSTIKRFSTLKHLKNIKFANIDDNSTPKFVNEIFANLHFQNIRKITLNNCDGVNGYTLKIIASNCPFLNRFSLNQPKITEDNVTVEDLTNFASSCKCIEHLDLRCTNVSIAESIVDIISKLPILQKFMYSPNSSSTQSTQSEILNKCISSTRNNLKYFDIYVDTDSTSSSFILANRIP